MAASAHSWDFLLLRLRELRLPPLREARRHSGSLAAIMANPGIFFFHEAPSWQGLLGATLAIAGLFLLRK